MEGDFSYYVNELGAEGFQSTPSVWRETWFCGCSCTTAGISIHSLRMEGDIQQMQLWEELYLFQSTPSVWRETEHPNNSVLITLFQSTPSVWRETVTDDIIDIHENISIHSLRMEGDCVKTWFEEQLKLFQSTPSVWRETNVLNYYRSRYLISIHSLHTEGDPADLPPYHV